MPKYPRPWAVVVLSTAALVLAACGGGGDDAMSASPQATRSEGTVAAVIAAAEAVGRTGALAGATVVAPDDATVSTVADLLQTEASAERDAALADVVDAHVQGGAVREQAAAVGRESVQVLDGLLPRTSVDALVKALPTLDTLEAAVAAAGLNGALADPKASLTLFAPTNTAFARLLVELKLTRAQLLADKPLLQQVLTYHVLATSVTAQQVQDDSRVATLQGQDLAFDVRKRLLLPSITLTDARGRHAQVVLPNLQARNGVVHLIDRVVLPQTRSVVQLALASPQFSLLAKAVQAAGLVDALSAPGPFTVFAPTNDAFTALLGELHLSLDQLIANKALLTQVLTYHVLPGRVLARDIVDGSTPSMLQGQPIRLESGAAVHAAGVQIRDARGRLSNVVATDLQAGNGVIHTIDRVLLPTDRNVVQLALSQPKFSILVEAVVAAGLVDRLSQPGAITVFAPTNAAFAALLQELHLSKEQLLADRALLTRVLTYHVLDGRVLKNDIPFGRPVATLEGGSFTIAPNLSITDARGRHVGIQQANLVASNGVVHVVDRVLLPH